MKQSLESHLDELRKRIVEFLVLFFVVWIGVFSVMDRIVPWITKIVDQPLVFFAPQDALLINMSMSAHLSFMVLLPVFLIQVWRFIASGLHAHERKKLVWYLFVSLGLFAVGASLAYFVVVPLGIKVLLSYGAQFYEPMISVRELISLLVMLLMVFGVMFQLPLFLLFLSSIGVVTSSYLKEHRFVWYVGAFVVAALLTPPDVITQIVLGVPLIILFEASYILICLRERI